MSQSTEMKTDMGTSSKTPEVMYVKLLGENGEEYTQHFMELPYGTFITGLEFGFMNEGETKRPIVRLPFSMHGDVKTLHTICSRWNDDVTREYEW